MCWLFATYPAADTPTFRAPRDGRNVIIFGLGFLSALYLTLVDSLSSETAHAEVKAIEEPGDLREGSFLPRRPRPVTGEAVHDPKRTCQ